MAKRAAQANSKQDEDKPVGKHIDAGRIVVAASTDIVFPSENEKEVVTRSDACTGTTIATKTTYYIGRKPQAPLPSRRNSGRRRGAPRVFDDTTIEHAQADLRRALERHPHWRDRPSFAVKHVEKFLGLDPKGIKTKTKTIRRHIVDPVIAEPG